MSLSSRLIGKPGLIKRARRADSAAAIRRSLRGMRPGRTCERVTAENLKSSLLLACPLKHESPALGICPARPERSQRQVAASLLNAFGVRLSSCGDPNTVRSAITVLVPREFLTGLQPDIVGNLTALERRFCAFRQSSTQLDCRNLERTTHRYR